MKAKSKRLRKKMESCDVLEALGTWSDGRKLMDIKGDEDLRTI